jgi:choline dehydrogenase-like flavoprotein
MAHRSGDIASPTATPAHLRRLGWVRRFLRSGLILDDHFDLIVIGSGPGGASLETRIAELSADLSAAGLHPFHLPLGILLDEKDGKPTPTSTCIRCSYFDGFPCLLNGQADAQVICIDPMLARHPNVTLLTGAYVSKLGTDPFGRSVDAVDVTRSGREEVYSADVVVAACGALSSALLPYADDSAASRRAFASSLLRRCG